MFFTDYQTILTIALALLLLLAVIRLFQIHNERNSKSLRIKGETDATAVSSLLEHEEIEPLLNDLSERIESEFGFKWSKFTVESVESVASDNRQKSETGGHKSERLFKIDQDLSVRFSWNSESELTKESQHGSHLEKLTTIKLDSVERLTRSYVTNLKRIQRYKRLANRDALTGLFNVSYLKARLNEEIERAKRFERSVGVLILDVDHFKEINDQQGHLRGDYALRFLSGLMLENVRAIDIVCRYGGDELCIILPDADEPTIRGTMTRLQSLICERSIEATGMSLTVSIGGALSRLGEFRSEELFEEADKAMLLAKRRGRNQCYFASAGKRTSIARDQNR